MAERGVWQFCVLWTVLFCAQLISPVLMDDEKDEKDKQDLAVLYPVEDITSDQFPNTVKQHPYVLALFYEAGCVSCDMAQDVHKYIIPSDIFPGNLAKVQLSDMELAKSLGIKEFPSFVLMRKGNPVLYDVEIVNSESVEAWLDIAHEVGTKDLNDDSFEHLTQASTGATTGDWLVTFYQSTCSDVNTVMESFAVRFKRKMNVAKVDMDASPKLVKRLKVNKCPTVIFFRQGKMYRYEVEKYDTKSLTSFVEGWYKNMKAEKVPGEPTGFDELTESIAKALKDQVEGPNRAMFLGIVGGLSALVVLIILIACVASRRSAQKKKLY